MLNFLLKILPIADVLLVLFVYPSAWLLKNVRRAGVHRLPLCKEALMRVGVFPVWDHYYEPQFDHRATKQPFSQDRILPGIDWNDGGQRNMIGGFTFAQEIADLPQEPSGTLEFCLNNGTFVSGDAEYWYQLIRCIKPARIFEIGSGNSTLMAMKALTKNKELDENYHCRHVCIEPYETPWLERAPVEVVRAKAEDLPAGFFSELEENDILFIDSSHVIRPQGDVLFEYLELLPTLNKGVIVHLHDIFSPKNYPAEWLQDEVKFWNEQYLLEAFLSHNKSWEIIGALNYLHHNHYDSLKKVAPSLMPSFEPGSFYIRKVA